MKIKKLPEAELEIMLLVWEAGESVVSDYLMEQLQGKKTWAKTTVLNFLLRLIDKGFLTSERHGKINIYTPIISKEEYLAVESKGFFSKLHNGSLTHLVATLYNTKSITRDDLDELKRFIEEHGENE
jgi:predicted transcriptional regulator